MAIASVTEAAYEPASIAVGHINVQFVEVVINSGATSGTLTASRLKDLKHVIIPGISSYTAAPTYSGNVATLAFTVPAETASSRTVDGITYTAVANKGVGGNNISIQEVDGTGDVPAVTNGNETVFVTGNAIVVHIDPTAVTGSTRTNVRIAINANAAASALVTATGTSATVASVTAKTNLQSGVSGGCRCTAMCIGRGGGASK